MNQSYEYRYITKDGGPPNGGVPPSRPGRGPPPQSPKVPFCSHRAGPSSSCKCPPPAGHLYKCYGPCMGPPATNSAPKSCPFIRAITIQMPPKPPTQPSPYPPRPLPRKANGDEMKAPPGSKHNNNSIRFPDGTGFLFPELTVLINVIEKGVEPWKQPGGKFKYQGYWVSIKISVNELIRQLGAREGSRAEDVDCKFGIIEIFERGNGVWSSGSKFRLGDIESVDSLEAKGWTENRGRLLRPVWMVVFKD